MCHGNLSCILYFSPSNTKWHKFQPYNCVFLCWPSVSARSWTQNWRQTQRLCSHLLVEMCVCPLLMNQIHHTAMPPIVPTALLRFFSTLIGRGCGNLPPQTCFLTDPRARSVFLANYHLPSEMICNMASAQWITLPPAIYMTCQYPLSVADISGGNLGGVRSNRKITAHFKNSSARLMSTKQQSSGSSSVSSPSLCYIANDASQHLCRWNDCNVNHLKRFGIGKASDWRCQRNS